MKALPPEVSLGQLLDIIKGKKPKPVPRRKLAQPLNKWWVLHQPQVRHFTLKDAKAFEHEWQDFVDSIPRKNRRFLALVAEVERKRAIAQAVLEKRARGRAKYLKRMALATADEKKGEG